MLEALGKHAEGQDLCLRHGFIGGRTVGKYSRQLRHFRQPASILLALTFNAEVHGVLQCPDVTILRSTAIRGLIPQ